ncbi:MAG: DUF167 domain-containing protein [Spirochaetes bacterium]|nr:DUF167 domain-containing protein [Spirochaetota bacterium]
MPVSVSIKVVPNAKRVLLKSENNSLKLYINRPPVDGKANEAVIEYFSDALDIPKRDITIIRGATSRQKVLSISVAAGVWNDFLKALQMPPG